MQRSKLRHLLLVLALALVAAACGSDGGDGGSAQDAGDTSESTGEGAASEDEACTPERKGGTLTMSTLALGQSLDPYVTAGGSANTALELLALYDSLVRLDEESGEFVGQLAESIEPNEDASEWTLTLREGIEFGNGDPMDAAAVKASIDRHLDPAGESRMKSAAQFVKSVDVVDGLTLRFVLHKPWGYFPVLLAAGGGSTGALGMIQNVKLIEERGPDGFGKDSTGGGAGPYEVEKWAPPEEVVLTAKEGWWGGDVCIEQLRFVSTESGQARLDGLRAGELDMALQYRDPVVAAEAKEELEHATSINHGGNYLAINAARPELSDVRVRRAIAMAIDPEVIDQRAFGGMGLPTSGLVHEASPILEPTDGVPFEPDEAKALVEELKDEGMELSFELIVGQQASTEESAIAVEALLEAAGFDITVSTLPTAQLTAQVNGERNFDLTMSGQTGSEATLYASLARLASDNPGNFVSFKEPDFDAALDELRVAQGTDELQEAIEQVQEVWNELVPAVVVAADEAAWVWRPEIKGLYFTRGVTPYFDKAYIDE